MAAVRPSAIGSYGALLDFCSEESPVSSYRFLLNHIDIPQNSNQQLIPQKQMAHRL
ncbi:MAG TPA: hypothetical protein VFF50_04540 [Candidatus Deferrimicrobiaceae bacterium]|jgi:hypothetical protein|nr:hypothetical protein [Candidatus Deferrimicrobiaceae bacterium]